MMDIPSHIKSKMSNKLINAIEQFPSRSRIVIAYLNKEKQSKPESPPQPSDYADRVEYRKALIGARKNSVSAQVERIEKHFNILTIKPTIGEITNVVIFTATPDFIIKAMDTEDIEHAEIDTEIWFHRNEEQS